MRTYLDIEVQHQNEIVARTMKEHLWTEEFTKAAMDEYKKFITLSIKYNVAPSYVVDQVWHTHLLYTKSYNNMCKLIGKYIDHGPNEVREVKLTPIDEYVETKRLYTIYFGYTPNELYWSKEFPKHTVYVPLSKYWIIPAGNTRFLFKLLFKHLKSKLKWGY